MFFFGNRSFFNGLPLIQRREMDSRWEFWKMLIFKNLKIFETLENFNIFKNCLFQKFQWESIPLLWIRDTSLKNYDFRKTWSIWPILKCGQFSCWDPILRERRTLATNGQAIRNVTNRLDTCVLATLDASLGPKICFSRFWAFLAKTVLRFSSISHANDLLAPNIYIYLWSLDAGKSGRALFFLIWLCAKMSLFRGGTKFLRLRYRKSVKAH